MRKSIIFPFDIHTQTDRPKLVVRVRTYSDGAMERTQFIRFHWPICIEDVVDSVMLRTKADECYLQEHMYIKIPNAEDLFNVP
jgi:hypothetical protein